MEKPLKLKTLPKLTMQQKQQNQEVLQRINRKIDFKKNPRYEIKNLQKYTDVNTQQNTVTNANQNQGPFRCDPPFIRFQNYKKDNLYEFQINVVNYSKITKRIKIAPLKSKQFTVSQIKYPNSNTGDIAPGLSVKINVRFLPNSLADFTDQLVILSDSNIIKVPILAKLQQPNLSFPKIIDCGNCWVGEELNTKCQLVNRGGDTKFMLSSATGSTQNQKLLINNFIVFPREGTLTKNEKISISAYYKPKMEGKMQQTIDITYDNGEKSSFKLIGAGYCAELKLMQMNRQLVTQESQNLKIYFDDVYPNEPIFSKIKIKNLATVNLNYRWNIKNKYFKIKQQANVFKPLQEKQFTLEFQSPQNIPIFSQAQLILENIPIESIKRKTQSNDSHTQIQSFVYYRFNLITCPKQYQIIVEPPCFIFPDPIFVNTNYKSKFKMINKHNSDIEYKIESINHSKYCSSNLITAKEGILKKKSSQIIEIQFRIQNLDYLKKIVNYIIHFKNAQCAYLSIQGVSKPAELLLESYTLDFGLLRQNSSVSKQLKFTNTSTIPLKLKIQNNQKYHYPQYSQLYQYDQENFKTLKKRLEIQQQQFSLNPGEQRLINFTYNALNKQSFNTILKIQVIDGKQHLIEVFAEIQDIYLVLSKGYFNLKDIYVGNIYNLNQLFRGRNPLMLLNLGNIDAEYEWEPVQTNIFQIDITPKKGIVKSKSKQQVEIVIKPLRSTNLNYISKCQIKSFNKSLQLHIQAQMKGLQVLYYLMNQALAKRVKVKEIKQELNRTKSKKVTTITHTSTLIKQRQKEKEKLIYPNLQKIQFFNCQINKPKQIYIILENISDLNSQFELEIQNYKSTEKVQKNINSKETLLNNNSLPFNSEMGKTLIANRMLQKLQKSNLSNNKGVTILCEPSSGQLLKNSEVKIKLTLFNDICGHFIDKLKIKIKDHEVKQFPIEIDIRGTPVWISKNQVGIDFSNQFPIFKLGAFAVGSGFIKKEFKVINNGPKPVEVNWKIYSINKSTNQNLFTIKIQDPPLGSSDLLKVKWQALEPPEQQNSSFAIQPRNKIIKGRQQSVFIVSYKTASSQKIQKSILVGETNLISQNKKIKMELLSIITQGQSISPKLTMDIQHANIIPKFQRYAGISDNQKSRRTVILENQTEANLIFSIEIENKRFIIVDTKTNSSNTNKIITNNSFNSSKGLIKTNRQIQKSFNLVSKSYVQITIELQANQKQLDDWPLVKRIIQNGSINIEFSNGQKQTFPLLGQLLRPQLILNTTGIQGKEGDKILDFGIVHTKNSKNLPIYLVNPSLVKGSWSLKYIKYPVKKSFEPILWTALDKEDQQIVDQKECFQFSKTQGVVESLTIPLRRFPSTLALPTPQDQYAKTHIPQKIMINFKPKKNVLYKSKFKITVQEGQPIQFIVRGMGTYAQQKQI